MVRAEGQSGLGIRGKLVLAAWVLLMLAGVAIALLSNQADLRAYQAGVNAWLRDESQLYTGELVYMGFTLVFAYPPIAAVLFVPLGVLPLPVATVVLSVLSMAGITATALVAARSVDSERRRWLVRGFGVAALAVLLEPVWSTLFAGQINIVLMALIVLDCLLPRTKWPRGLLIGIAAAIKLTPLIFVLFFVVRRQWRPAITAVATTVVANLLGFLVSPGASRKYWFGGSLFDERRLDFAWWPMNQSIKGVVSRFGVEGTANTVAWALVSLLVVVVVWIGARRARAAGDDLLALMLVAVAGLFISPLSWTHHWVWVVPGLVLLARLVRRPRSVPKVVVAAVVLLIFVLALPLVMTEGGDAAPTLSVLERVIAEAYVLTGLALLVAGLFGRMPGPAAGAAREPVATADGDNSVAVSGT